MTESLGPQFSSEEYHKIDRKIGNGPEFSRQDNGISNKVTPDAGEHRDFVKVYRGFQQHPKDVNFHNLGQHWSLRPLVADYFSKGGQSQEEEVQHGTIVEALIHKKHFITAEHPDFKGFRDSNQINDNPGEREMPVLSGAPVSIQNVYHMTNTPETEDSEHYMGEENWGNAKKVKSPTDLGRA